MNQGGVHSNILTSDIMTLPTQNMHCANQRSLLQRAKNMYLFVQRRPAVAAEEGGHWAEGAAAHPNSDEGASRLGRMTCSMWFAMKSLICAQIFWILLETPPTFGGGALASFSVRGTYFFLAQAPGRLTLPALLYASFRASDGRESYVCTKLETLEKHSITPVQIASRFSHWNTRAIVRSRFAAKWDRDMSRVGISMEKARRDLNASDAVFLP